ncbi:synaptotagmin-14 isoform X1 [Drosophila ananassae]|uniref:synaptotagmin-14 isoform X1 n=1 Tax=Drosophila ananassae TaxID=7217 RepID=UPI0013A5F27D|nr:synaptotagmin-14 isoform X1 [Drosophila ananassae]
MIVTSASGLDSTPTLGTVEVTTLLGVFFGVLVLLLLLFLYISRKCCFHYRHAINCCDERHLAAKCVQKITRKRRYENTSSDSEEDILRRLRWHQQHQLGDKHGNYGMGINQANPLTAHSFNYHHAGSDLQRVTVTRDPLAVAERGKVGIPSSHSECSSNDSMEASVDSHTGILTGESKGKQRQAEDVSGLLIELDILTGSHPASSYRNPYADHRAKTQALRYQHRVEVVMPPKHDKERDSNSVVVPMSNSCNNNNSSVANNNNTISTNNNNNNNDDEPLFDTSDLRSIKSDDMLVGGDAKVTPRGPIELELSLLYDAPMRKMTVHVMQARSLPPLASGQPTHTQVRMLMLPTKKQKLKTKIRSGENPQYMESFLLHRVNPEDVNNMGLRVRLYGCERLRKERLIGEAYVSFATVDLELETNLWLPLEPRNTSSVLGSTSDLLSLARSESAGSTSSMQHGGVSELLLGLSYNGVTGRLSVEVIKGSQFRSLSLNKAPDTYVKMVMVSSIGQEISRAKTSIRRGQPNPLFKETFAFQVALFQLNDVTLMISVYAKRHMKKNEMVGWFSMGLNSSGPEEVAHWTDVCEMPKGEMLARWHVLVDS